MNGTSVRRRRFLLAGSRAAVAAALLARLPGLRAEQRHSQADTSATVVGLAFDPAGQVLYKASERVVHRSADGGRVWSPVELPKRSGDSILASIAVAAAAPASRPALYVAGHGAGVLRSDDGGQSWVERNDGLPGTDVAALTAHADRPETVYVYVKAHGIYRSEDAGRHWRLMDAGPRGGITTFIHSNMPGSMQSGWFFVGGAQGVRRAMDCFCSWRDAGELGRAVGALAYDPHRPSEIYAAPKTGLLFSRDGGETWSEIDAPASAIDALTVTPRGEIYAASQGGGLYVRDTATTPWKRLDA
ncbi:MAG: YCF48-related protein [Pseudomonadota bacterium]|nr:YCF48-related protein [Pseudomonadota bacterium]